MSTTLLPRRGYRYRYTGTDVPAETDVPITGKEIPEPIYDSGSLNNDAPFWKAYVLEADQVDKEMGEDWDKTLDVMLIFAALFSAIATAFIIESMKNLQPDPAQLTVSGLAEISRILVAISNNQPVSMDALVGSQPPTAPPSHLAIVVNSLWLSSLGLSLGVSLMAMLAKKWCLRFLSGRSGPYCEQARRRQDRWDGIVKWRMEAIMNALPLLMHIALALFAVGLVVYLWDINRQVAKPVLIITAIFLGLYAVCTILPFISQSCPYGTILSDILDAQIIPGIRFFLLIILAILVMIYVIIVMIPVIILSICGLDKWVDHLGDFDRLDPVANLLIPQHSLIRYRNRRARPAKNTRVPADHSTSGVVSWLASNSEHSENVDAALRALSGASIELPTRLLIRSDMELTVFARLKDCFHSCWDRSGEISLKEATDLALASTGFQALFHLLESDRDWGYKWDKWNRHGKNAGTFGAGMYSNDLVAVYRLLSKKHLDATKGPEEFVRCTSALMPATHWVFEYAEHTFQTLVDDAAAQLLSLLISQKSKKFKLGDSVLSEFSRGCAHYLIPRIWETEQEVVTSQLVLTLLTIDIASDRSSSTLRYTLAVTLASCALAAKKGHPLYFTTDDDTEEEGYLIPAVKLLQRYIHQGSRLQSDTEQLQTFGVLGIIHLLPFESLTYDQACAIIKRAVPMNSDSIKSTCKIKLKLSSKLDWDEHAAYAVYDCLQKVPDVGSYPSLEYVVSWCLQEIPGITKRLDQLPNFESGQLVSWMCRCETDKLWESGLVHLGIHIEDQSTLDSKTLGLLAEHELTAHLFKSSIAGDPFTSPLAMCRLWQITQLILSSKGETPNTRLTAINPLLKCAEYKKESESSGDYGLPNDITDILLERYWYNEIERMVASGPAPRAIGRVIELAVTHQERKESNVDELEKGDLSTHGNTEILQKWKKMDDMYKVRRRAQERWMKARRILRVMNCLTRNLDGAFS